MNGIGLNEILRVRGALDRVIAKSSDLRDRPDLSLCDRIEILYDSIAEVMPEAEGHVGLVMATMLDELGNNMIGVSDETIAAANARLEKQE